MENAEIIKGNIEISKLFGDPMPFNDSRKGKITLYFKPGHNTAHCMDYELDYHSDWNWLMAAVEKIELSGSKYDTRINHHADEGSYFCDIVDEENNEIACQSSFDSKKEAVYKAVVEAAEFLNNLKS